MYPLWLVLGIVLTEVAYLMVSYLCIVHGIRAMRTQKICIRRTSVYEGTHASTIGAWLFGMGILHIAYSLFIVSRLWASA